MNIPQTAEYALRAIVWLAREPTAVRKTAEVARATQVPTGYLSKVLQALCREQLLTSTAGRKGGFRIARPASQISVLDVIRAVGPVGRIQRCPLGLASHNGALCPLHRRLDEAMESIERAFAATCISELLQEDHGRLALCEPSGNGDELTVPAAVREGQTAGTGRRGRRPRAAGVGERPPGEED